MHRSLHLLHLGVVLSLSATAGAQTPLLLEGDTGWSGTAVVANVQNVDVNDNGDWLVEADGGDDNSNDLGVVLNGTLIVQEGTNLGFPASHTIPGVNNWVAGTSTDAMDINDNGDVLIQIRSCVDVDGLQPNRGITLWTSGTSGTTYVLFEEGVTPIDNLIVPAGSGLDEPMGATWDSIAEIWQNNNNQMLVNGRTTTDSDDIYVFVEHDGAGNITSQTLLASTFVQHDVVFGGNGTHLTPVQGFGASKQYQTLNNSGELIYYIDDDHVNAPGDTNQDSHIYKWTAATGVHEELIWEADLSPTGSGSPYNHTSTFEVDINDSGTWVMGCDDDSDAASDYFLQIVDPMGNTTIFTREGDLVPGLDPMLGLTVAGFGFGPVQISDTGDITWFCDWDDPTDPPNEADVDTGLFRNSTILIQEGVDDVGGILIDTISSSADGMAVSDNGRFIIIELTLADGREGAFLIELESGNAELCNGDGGDQMGCTDCPCANNAAPGTIGGCLNSAGTSARLELFGSASVSTADLRVEAVGAPPMVTAILVSGDALAPTNAANPCFGLGSGVQALTLDGLRCAVQGVLRHGARQSDALGNVGDTTPGWGMPNGFFQFVFVAGQTKYLQIFHRDNDMMVCTSGQNTSQAASVTFIP